MELNYQEIVNALQYQFNLLLQTDERFNDYIVRVVNEQGFEKEPLKSNEMLVLVRFGAASVLQKKVDLPITFTIIGLPNEIEKTQEFFNIFVLTYNEQDLNGMLEYFDTPSVSNRFTEYGKEFRTSLQMDGALVISLTNGLVDMQIFNEETQEFESIRFLNEELESTFAPLPEPTGDSNGRNITTNQANTITLSFSTYLNQSYFVRESIRYGFDKTLSFNKRFLFRLDISGIYVLEETFVLSSVSINGQVAENSVLSVVLVV